MYYLRFLLRKFDETRDSRDSHYRLDFDWFKIMEMSGS